MAESLKIYPSGFLGSRLVAQTKPPEARTSTDELFNRGLSKLPSKFVANEEVVNLWLAAVSGVAEYRTFEFKERILKAALQAFGTTKIADWIATQAESPHFTDLHAKWIEETVLFVLLDKRREMSNNVWKSLLTTGGEKSTQQAFTPAVADVLFADTGNARCASGYCRKDMTIQEFVLVWVRQNGGIDDLMVSLNVLFGKQ